MDVRFTGLRGNPATNEVDMKTALGRMMQTSEADTKEQKYLTQQVSEKPHLIHEEVGAIEMEMARKWNSTATGKLCNFGRRGHPPGLKSLNIPKK